MSDIVWHYLPEVPPSETVVFAACSEDGWGKYCRPITVFVVRAMFMMEWSEPDGLSYRFIGIDEHEGAPNLQGVYAWAEIVVPAAPPLERP